MDKTDGHNGDEREDGARCAAELIIVTGATGTEDSSKRTADNAGLSESGESADRSEKVRRKG